jgi:hypothetical protein
MIIINSIGSDAFSINGDEYNKIYQPLKMGVNGIGIYNVYDTKLQLLNSTDFSEFNINGNTYASQGDVISALIPIIYNGISDSELGTVRWGDIEDNIVNQTDLIALFNTKANIDDLGLVAFTNSYNSLDDLPDLNNLTSSPAGDNTEIQFNDNGAFGATPGLTYNGSELGVKGDVILDVEGISGGKSIKGNIGDAEINLNEDSTVNINTSPGTSNVNIKNIDFNGTGILAPTDLSAFYSDTHYIQKGYVDTRLENYISLEGTSTNNDVTGDVVFSSDSGVVFKGFNDEIASLKFDENEEIFGVLLRENKSFNIYDNYFSPIMNVSSSIIYLKSDLLRLSTSTEGITLQNNSTGIKIEDNAGIGLYGAGYFGSEYFDNSYIQKKYVDDNFLQSSDLTLKWTSGVGVDSIQTVTGANSANGNYSTASGYQTTAGGTFATAFGYNVTANGQTATAFGNSTTASGMFSTTWGNNSEGTEQSTTAFGNNTTASGVFATAFGNNTTADGNKSTAWGENTIANGDTSTAWGKNATADGDYATAFGFDTTASGVYSTAFGESTSALGYGSTVLGYNSTANAGDVLSLVSGYENDVTGYASLVSGYKNILTGQINGALGSYHNVSKNYAFTIGAGLIQNSIGGVSVGIGNTDFSNTTFNSGDARMFVVGNGTLNVAGGGDNGNTINTRSDAFIIKNSGEITAPSLTNTIIDNELTGKVIITKDYADANYTDTATLSTNTITFADSQTITVPQKYSELIGDGVELVYTITHNLNTEDIVMSIVEVANGELVSHPEKFIVDNNNVRVEFKVIPTTDEFRVIVIG